MMEKKSDRSAVRSAPRDGRCPSDAPEALVHSPGTAKTAATQSVASAEAPSGTIPIPSVKTEGTHQVLILEKNALVQKTELVTGSGRQLR
jgi:hypothetical protein